MSDELISKGVPLGAVVYVVRFDARGRPLREVAFHVEVSGTVHVDGSAAGSLEALLLATRESMRVTVGQDMLSAIREREGRDLAGLGDLSRLETGAPSGEVLPAAGEGW